MLFCKEIFTHDLVFNVSRFFRLCLQTRFITKRKEIDVKSVYLNFGSDKVATLSIFHTFSGTYIKGNFFWSRKKELLVIFQKVSKVINEAFASLGTIIKLTNKTIARLEKSVSRISQTF